PGVLVLGRIASAISFKKSILLFSNKDSTFFEAGRVQPSKNRFAPITEPPNIKATRCIASLLFIVLTLKFIIYFPTRTVCPLYKLVDLLKVGHTHIVIIPQQF